MIDVKSPVKALRLTAGMTQREFCDYFEIPKRTLQDWESKRTCSIYLLKLIEYKLTHEGLIKDTD